LRPVCCHIMEKVPFLVRRARLLLGETQMQFAERFGVEDGTVSRWERGKLRPHPQALKQIRGIAVREGSFLSEALIRASHVAKIVAPMDDLTRALVVSEGVKDALKQAGVSYESLGSAIADPKEARTSPHYEASAVRALELIQADPRWLKGEIVYAEAHCLSLRVGEWIHMMVAPLPDRCAALIEAAPSRRGPEEGFWVHLVEAEDIPSRKLK
jgi:transcriptional regulator with XRE-family HTH domain